MTPAADAADSADIRALALRKFVSARLHQNFLALEPLGGDASARRYFRVKNLGVIAVDAPPESQKNREFAAIAELLDSAGIRVPTIWHMDLTQGFFILEDLGNVQFAAAAIGGGQRPLYLKAVSLLPVLAGLETAGLPEFDAAFIGTELNIFSEWMLERHLGLTLSDSEKAGLEMTREALTDALQGQPQTAMHRDFHSRNLMVCTDGDLAVLDFQDMVRGPVCYDAASLFYDCYINLPPELIGELTADIFQKFKASGIIPAETQMETFRYWLISCSLQRHLKVLGIFERLSLRDGKHGYLKDLPRVYDYAVAESALYPEYAWIHEFLLSRVGGNF